MVNEKVLGYLREGQRRGFGLEILKQKLHEGNFSEQDINEAEALILNESSLTKTNLVQSPRPQSPPLQSYSPLNSLPTKVEKKGVAWMKIAGIIGIITSILLISLFVYSLYLNFSEKSFNSVSLQRANSGENTSSYNVWLIAGIGIFLILQIIYYLGFIKMGKILQLGSLSFGAWLMIILLVLLPIVSIFAVTCLQSVVQSSMQDSLASLGGLSADSDSGSALAGPTINKTAGYILAGIYLFLFVLYLVVQIIIGIGLLEAGKEIRFSKIAGILRFAYFVLVMVGISLLVYAAIKIMSNPLLILAIFTGLITYKNLILIGQFIFFLVISAVVLFESLALFDASNKFE
jgi:hypothetical protein